MQAKRPYGCSSTLFLTLLICLQCSDDDFGEGDVWRSVLYEPGGWLVNLLSVDFSIVEYTKHNKKGIRNLSVEEKVTYRDYRLTFGCFMWDSMNSS